MERLGTNPGLKSESMSPGQKSLTFLFKGVANIDIVLALLIAVSELIFVALPDLYIYIYNIYNMKGEIIIAESPHQTWLFTTVLIFATFWLILESWLYETLYKGALELESKHLNRWVNVRMLFLAASIMQTLYRIIQLEFCFYDTIYIPVFMYRILEILFVKGLTVEIYKAQCDLNC